jgi:D-amino peptidase
MKQITILLIMLAMLAMLSYLHAGEKTTLKVYISVDMEGIWGVVQADQTMADGKDFGPARKWMVQDVNAAIEGLLEAEATEIVVNDSHGSMCNIIADELHPKASLISGTPKPLSMMQGIDDHFDACVFIGYHAKAGTAAAVLDHTISGKAVRAIRVNGIELPELGLNGALAGYFNVPVIMLSGDDETCRQAKAILGDDIITVPVKQSIGRFAAKLLPVEEARKRLREGAKEALLKRNRISPFKLNAPYSFELEVLNSSQAEMPSQLPQVKRTSARSLSFSANDFLEGFKILRVLIALASQ